MQLSIVSIDGRPHYEGVPQQEHFLQGFRTASLSVSIASSEPVESQFGTSSESIRSQFRASSDPATSQLSPIFSIFAAAAAARAGASGDDVTHRRAPVPAAAAAKIVSLMFNLRFIYV